MIQFTVYGKPEPQGSARAFVLERPGQRARAIITSDNKKLKSWRQEVTRAAITAMEEYELVSEAAVTILVDFYFQKPVSVPKKKLFKTTKPDVDKLLRGVLDGLTGVVFRDDAQVIDARARKHFDACERTEIYIGLKEGVTL